MANRTDTLARILARCAVTESGCLEWTGSRHRRGYGQTHFEGRNRETHRVVYELTFGPIPDGLHVCHCCDNPPCCNVEHLFLGTRSDNMRDAASKGRIVSGLPWPRPRGEALPQSKLSDAQRDEIRTRHAGGATQAQLARDYNVDPSTVNRVIHGRSR